jgi:hypothetical protein
VAVWRTVAGRSTVAGWRSVAGRSTVAARILSARR